MTTDVIVHSHIYEFQSIDDWSWDKDTREKANGLVVRDSYKADPEKKKRRRPLYATATRPIPKRRRPLYATATRPIPKRSRIFPIDRLLYLILHTLYKAPAIFTAAYLAS